MVYFIWSNSNADEDDDNARDYNNGDISNDIYIDDIDIAISRNAGNIFQNR